MENMNQNFENYDQSVPYQDAEPTVNCQQPYQQAQYQQPETPAYSQQPYEPEPVHIQQQNQYAQFVPDYNVTPKKSRKKSGRVFKVILRVFLILCLVAGSSVASIWYTVEYMDKSIDARVEAQIGDYYKTLSKSITDLYEQMDRPQDVTQNVIMMPDGEVFEGQLTPAQVYAMNMQAVVAISNQGVTTNIFGQTSETASTGSGFIISEDGYIVSNYHVASGASTLTVILWDGTEYNATVVGYDDGNDVSLLKIDGKDLPHAVLGSSDSLVVGDQVAAIGNPLGELTSTLTVGYVSAMDRNINTDGTVLNMIQTDAAINSGNSGGPLFNMRGEVIGITTAKYTGTSASGATIEGIGFAIPISDVKDTINDLQNFGFIKSGYLGVMVQDVVAEDAQQYGLPLGALVIEVMDGGCAKKAGIMEKDIITYLGGQKVDSVNDLTRVLRNFEGGEETIVTVYRGGQEVHLTVVLDGKLPETK